MALGLPPGALASETAPRGVELPNPAIEINLRIISPVSCARGTTRLQYNQVLAQTTLPMAGLLVIILDIIAQIAVWCFDGKPISRTGSFQDPDGNITLSLSQLADFLKGVKPAGTSVDLPVGPAQDTECNYDGIFRPRPGVVIGPVQPLTVVLVLNGTAGTVAGTPVFSLTVPLFSLSGITGGLPIVILGLMDTILERFVVPPRCSGIVPPTTDGQGARTEPRINLKPQELIQMLRYFGKNFGK